ncbi:hypothetical protein FCG40_07880 [Fimbriimonadia bacterium ATM]|nr:MAG: hypothetical protein EDM73_00110 [Armatimonadota bacterium]MBC6969563.1 hypothetical protein [Armatimonadota bacterium]MCE7898832.1 hypothetical protein [Armatimonadetes bacterium ATM1]MDL1928896.1 hypothetical protein [Fimbriimonadia bacterium ATM]RIJ97819.1 MAG: hypothetical protein DCC45_01780 [Armatimonadota bacterium]
MARGRTKKLSLIVVALLVPPTVLYLCRSTPTAREVATRSISDIIDGDCSYAIRFVRDEEYRAAKVGSDGMLRYLREYVKATLMPFRQVGPIVVEEYPQQNLVTARAVLQEQTGRETYLFVTVSETDDGPRHLSLMHNTFMACLLSHWDKGPPLPRGASRLRFFSETVVKEAGRLEGLGLPGLALYDMREDAFRHAPWTAVAKFFLPKP